MVKIRSGTWWKSWWCKHRWEYMFFEQRAPKSYRYIKRCYKCKTRELFTTKDLEGIPWQ